MADWSMEPAAPWAPCDLQLVEWTVVPAVCPPGLLAVECASTEKFGNYLETSVPVSKEGQLVEYDPVETAEYEFVVDLYNLERKVSSPIRVFKDVADDYKVDINMTEWRIHKFPAGIRALCLSEWYTVPMVVAIGPYHHDSDHLKQTEKVKVVAAYNCIKNSGRSLETLYDAVVSKANDAHELYANDVVKGIPDKDFLPMMFLDACFLVQYMLCMSDSEADIDDSLCHFFNSNDEEIFHDIMLLENQIPWPVVEAILKFVYVPLDNFIKSLRGCLQDRKVSEENQFIMDHSYKPPHLLGLLRFYIVGENKTKPDDKPKPNTISFSLSAIELAEIGITLKPSETNQLIHMGLKTEGTIFPELSLAPLSLSRARESWLVNMAAHELCTTSNFTDAEDEESAVCSYLLLLAMLVGREEDVQELRAKGILQGGGFTNKEALDFLTNVQGLRVGSCYLRVMNDIEDYRVFKRRTRANLHAWYYRNSKNIAWFGSAFVTVVTLLGTYLGLKK